MMRRPLHHALTVAVVVFACWGFVRAVDWQVAQAGERLSERAESPLGESVTGRVVDLAQVASMPSGPRSESLYPANLYLTGPQAKVPAGTLASVETIQGRGILWWHRRAVQARKDSNARGRMIRRLQTVARTRLVYPTGHWLDGAFLCIHRHERGAAGWQTATGNGYRGGLQMDSTFSRTYGPRWARKTFGESPHLWPASVQIATAIHAWTSRGFGPWPTRRYCGL